MRARALLEELDELEERRDRDEERNESSTGNDVISKLGLRVVYEDTEIVVVTAPNESELREIILKLLRERPMTVKELHSILAGIASEDKIRKSLMKLAENGYVSMDEDGRYRLIGFVY